MRKVKQLHLLFSGILILLLIGCNNDDDNPIKNKAPESFQLTEENFTVMYNREKETVNIDWPNVKDPDGEPIKYHLKVNDVQKASDLSNSEVELPSSEFTDLMSNHTFEITATDPGGLNSTVSAERILFSSEAPHIKNGESIMDSQKSAMERWKI